MDEPQRKNDMSKWRLVESRDVLGTEGNQCQARYYPDDFPAEVWICQLTLNHESEKHAVEPAWTVT